MKKSLLLLLSCLLSSAAFAGLIDPATTVGLYNTGVDGSGTKLAHGSTELHWLVDALPAASVYENGAYFGVSTNSLVGVNWITGGAADNGGTIPEPLSSTFTLSFDLTGYVPGSVTITGLWGTDNFGSILLNGSATGITLPSGNDQNNFKSLHNFAISSGFQTGVNTIQVVLENEGGPGAFLVYFTSVEGMAVPEPSVLLSFLTMGSLGFLFIRRRR